jgi:hypothetical protein
VVLVPSGGSVGGGGSSCLTVDTPNCATPFWFTPLISEDVLQVFTLWIHISCFLTNLFLKKLWIYPTPTSPHPNAQRLKIAAEYDHRLQTGSEAHPASYSVGIRGSFLGGRAAGAWSWTSPPLPRVRMRGATTLLPHTSSWRGAYLSTRTTLPFNSSKVSLIVKKPTTVHYRVYRSPPLEYRLNHLNLFHTSSYFCKVHFIIIPSIPRSRKWFPLQGF